MQTREPLKNAAIVTIALEQPVNSARWHASVEAKDQLQGGRHRAISLASMKP
jgi:hypothetical protein